MPSLASSTHSSRASSTLRKSIRSIGLPVTAERRIEPWACASAWVILPCASAAVTSGIIEWSALSRSIRSTPIRHSRLSPTLT